jgi:hypothetical protein
LEKKLGPPGMSIRNEYALVSCWYPKKECPKKNETKKKCKKKCMILDLFKEMLMLYP